MACRFCSFLLIDAYRYPNVDANDRNYTYMMACTRYLGDLLHTCKVLTNAENSMSPAKHQFTVRKYLVFVCRQRGKACMAVTVVGQSRADLLLGRQQ